MLSYFIVDYIHILSRGGMAFSWLRNTSYGQVASNMRCRISWSQFLESAAGLTLGWLYVTQKVSVFEKDYELV